MFLPYKEEPLSEKLHDKHVVHYFDINGQNIDPETVESFGNEWEKFDYFSQQEINQIAKAHYFDIVPDEYLQNKKVLDMGCGTGRWSKYAANLAYTVDAVDPSKAILVAAKLLSENTNIRLSCASVDHLPFDDNSFDFVFSLGVLHHIPDTQFAMKNCVNKLKQGGYFLVYLYYNLDNKSSLFKSIFKISDVLRNVICRTSPNVKAFFCDILAVTIYMPFVLIINVLKMLGLKSIAAKMPLHFYADKSFNVIRNDSLDRFGTPLEQRFTKQQILVMMENSGLSEIVFSDNEPYWHAIGKKK